MEKSIHLVERPGYIGKRKKEVYEKWDRQFGEGNWKLVWKFGERLLDFEQACYIYEDAYFMDSFRRGNLWKDLFEKASDFYDNALSNVESGLDYLHQEAESVHIQDIAVRRVGLRRGWALKGDHLIQIRGESTEGYQFMPGIVKFHFPFMILGEDISPKWAAWDSVESWYQNNRWLGVLGRDKNSHTTTIAEDVRRETNKDNSGAIPFINTVVGQQGRAQSELGDKVL